MGWCVAFSPGKDRFLSVSYQYKEGKRMVKPGAEFALFFKMGQLPENLRIDIMQNRGRIEGSKSTERGFSLMELCVVVALSAIIFGIAIPNLIGMRARYKLRSSAVDVLTAFKMARTEAVKRNVPVGIAITTTGTGSCTVFVDDGNNGAGGVIVANRGNMLQDPNEKVLFVTTPQNSNSLLNNTFTGNPEYNPGGMMANACQSGAGAGPPFVPCNSIEIAGSASLGVTYRIIFSITGQVDLQDSTDSGTTWK